MPEQQTHHILVVDDDADVLSVLTDLLRNDGFRATGAPNGEDALKIVQRELIDLVIVDLMMPRMDGWHVLREIKTYDTALPVIVLTGFITEQGESILTSHQADGYLVKPVDHTRLHTQLRMLLSDQRKEEDPYVVVVDDDPDIQQIVNHALSRRDIRVETFEAIQSAHEHIQAQPPDLIVLDLIFPKSHGFELCRALQAKPETAEIPILILTAHASRQNLVEAIRLGVRGFIAKPFSPNALADRVLKILKRQP